ncbi:MAG TPA: polysaccharide biosynthesis/export family protein [Pyrinomonadaceae bacterium]|nr:polysaccharide biosynthesis/export family protein [Pyrinomonadaceae bacterium]
MNTVISLTIFAFVLLSSLVPASAQETAGAMPVRPALSDSASAAKAAEPVLTEIYRVGVGDVLDVRLINSPNNKSTLFTVMPSGAIDFPVLGGAIMVGGMTTEEIQVRIAAELKRRAIEEKAQVSVGVRQYASHSVMVNGLVVNPGTRYLRREIVPLYVVLAESQLRNDAGRVVIMRGGSSGQPLDLSDPQTLNLTVQPGDVITVSNKPEEFYYIGGRINFPGQKAFQPGITLLQAILAAGGVPLKENRVEISRAGVDGKLTTVRYRIKDIKGGTVEDPKLQPGDRIEISK